jgi:mannose-6-phosphate isomerase
VIYISRPKYIRRVWGALTVEGADSPVGEVWWLYHDGSGSSALETPSAERPVSVQELVRAGDLPGNGIYPVLLKTLHTREMLSVQVHPGIDGGSLCKEETWIVLEAGQDAWMMGGLMCTSERVFRDFLQEGRVEEALRKVLLLPGDIYHIPPGTVHALGPGLRILEVQSNCDITYRLYDWGRVGADGSARELHLEQGIKAVDWSTAGTPVAAGTRGRIDSCRLDAAYTISDITGEQDRSIPGGALFFLATGCAEVAGTEFKSPTCFIADIRGGDVLLRGTGYLIEPGR